MLLLAGCSGSAGETGDGPLGWGGPIEAREARHWSEQSIGAAPRWSAAAEPTFVVAPAPVENSSGLNRRMIRGAAFLPDGRAVLQYVPIAPDSILLHMIDPASGTETEIPAPRAESGRSLNWEWFDMATAGDGLVLMGDNNRARTRERSDIWYFDGDGEFERPASYVGTDGVLLGAFADGSLAFAGRFGGINAAGTAKVSSVMSLRPLQTGFEPSAGDTAAVLFVAGSPLGARTRGGIYLNAAGGHSYLSTSATAEDTLWIVPTERPELLAVHRSGRIELKIEWEAGDRTVPPGTSEMEVERFPAATSLQVGTDGLIYVQRHRVDDGRLGYDPEWLVFDRAGELLARLHIPANRWVMAIGDGFLVAGAGLEARVYAVERPQ